jgi:tetratricopeptide (TPR) repeat protein
MKKALFGWQCCLFAALVCGWVVLAQSQSKKLWQVYADAGEMAFKESRQSTAEVMFLSAIKEAESEGVQDPWLGKINYELGDLYSSLGRLKEAEPVYNRAIAIFEKLKEPSNVAVVVKNLLSNYTAQDKYPEAEKCVKEGLEFVEQSKKAGDETMASVTSLAEELYMVLLAQSRIDDAKVTYERLLDVNKASKSYSKTLADHVRDRAIGLYHDRRYSEAERLLTGELALLKKQSALTTLPAAHAFNDLADVHYRQGRFTEAETEKEKSIEIAKTILGRDIPADWALADLALIQYAKGDGARAESLFQESLGSMKQRREQSSGEDRKSLALQIAERLERLAELYGGHGRNEQSAVVYKEALEIRQNEFGQGDAGSIATTKAYIAVLRKLNRDAEAQELEARLGQISK